MDVIIASIKAVCLSECSARKCAEGDYKICISRYPRHAICLIHDYMADIPEEITVRVYSVGGDGILFDCLNGVMAFKNAELAIVPYGMTNNFLQSFGVNKEPIFQDIQLQMNAKTVPTDVFRSGALYALNFCSIGVEAYAFIKTKQINKFLKGGDIFLKTFHSRFYKSLYYVGAFSAFLDKNVVNQHYEVIIDGVDYSGKYQVLHIANGSCYAGNKFPVRAAVPDDGFSEVLMVRSLCALRSLPMISTYLQGRYYKVPLCSLKQGRNVTIRSKTPMWIVLDEEAFMKTSMTVELLPGAVKIAIPDGLGYTRRADPDEFSKN
jgi:diacylglycerol kinase family enzyme